MTRLQLEQRGDEDEELAARVQVELVALGQALDERHDDRGHVDLGRLDRLLQEQRQQQVERALEGVEVQLEIADGTGHAATLAAGPDAAAGDGSSSALQDGSAASALRFLFGRPSRWDNTSQISPATNPRPDTHVFTRRPRM